MRIGDRVKIKDGRGITGKITGSDIWGMVFTVRFDDPNLIPNEMEYELRHLELLRKDSCPKCGNEYHKSQFNMHVWFDCLKCGKSKEDLE